MPPLKQLSCCIQWSETGAPFHEYGTVYGDGVVETFIVVPNRPTTFTIRLTSHGYISEGLTMVAFIDGNYQSNRSRVNLQPTRKDQPAWKTEIDFLLRQKEKSHGGGRYMGRQWRFDNHNIVADPNDGYKEGHFNELGTIEILVLRCRTLQKEDADYDGSSSGEDSDIFGDRPTREDLETISGSTKNKTEIVASKTMVVEPAQEEDTGGLFGFGGLFDGPGEAYDAYGIDRGQWTWHPQETQTRTYDHTPGNAQPYSPQRPHFRTPDYNPRNEHPHPHPQTWSSYHRDGPPRPSEKHVHWDWGTESNTSQPLYQTRQPHETQSRRQAFTAHHPPQQRPHSYVRLRPPPYAPQHMSSNYKNEASHMPPRQPQIHGGHQSWHPEHLRYPMNPATGNVSRPAQTSMYQDPSVQEHPRDGSVPQSYPTRSPQHEFLPQSNFGMSPAAAQPYTPYAMSQDANSQQFGSQPPYFVPHATQPWTPGQQPQDGPIPHQHVHAPPNAQFFWPVPVHTMQGHHQMPFPSPHYFPGVPNHAHAIPHMMGPPTTTPYFPPALFTAPPTEGISPKNTTFDQPVLGVDMNGGGNGGDHSNNNNASKTSPEDTNVNNGDWGTQSNTEANADQGWNNGNQNETNNGSNNWENNNGNGQNNNTENWDSNNVNGQTDNNNNSWDKNDNNTTNTNGAWDSGNNAADQVNDTWAKDNNATQANGSGDGWATSNNNNNTQNSSEGLVNPSSASVSRDLYGPHGPYYSFRALNLDEPKPDAEEEPRYDVPQSFATERGSTKQVQPGPGYQYYKKCMKPEYIDTFEYPYARFVFKYRTKEQLQAELDIEIDVEPSSDQETTELQNLDKQTLVEMLIRAKSALGGKVPSPPLTPVEVNTAEPRPIAIPAPDCSYLKYSLPAVRPFKSNGGRKSSSHSKSDENSQSKENNANWDNGNNTASNDNADNTWGNDNANNQANEQNWGCSAPGNWDGPNVNNNVKGNSEEEQQKRSSISFSMPPLQDLQAAGVEAANQPADQQERVDAQVQLQNDPNNEEHFIPKPPLAADDQWDAAGANADAGWT